MTAQIDVLLCICVSYPSRCRVCIRRECPDDLEESIATLIYCSQRISDIPELTELTHQFAGKYGKEWCALHVHDAKRKVNGKVMEKMGVSPPSFERVIEEMKEIAEVTRERHVQLTCHIPVKRIAPLHYVLMVLYTAFDV